MLLLIFLVIVQALVKTTDELEGEGRSLVIVALVGDVDGKDLHIRIFDANGDKVVDKAEKQLESGETITALKQQLTALKSQEDEQEIIDGSSLSLEDKQEIIRKATSSAGHTPLEGNLKPSFSSDENPEAKPRLVSILSPEWPAPPDSFPFGLVLLDAESKLWHGLWDRIRLTGTVVWNPLNTDGNQALASDEVRPVAAKLTDNYTIEIPPLDGGENIFIVNLIFGINDDPNANIGIGLIEMSVE